MNKICSQYAETLGKYFKENLRTSNYITEEFDISGKIDTNNPIYRFYEKDMQKYLNKFGGKRVIDDKGVSWIEIPITKEQGKAPVEAFGKTSPGILFPIAGATLAGAVVAGQMKKSKPVEGSTTTATTPIAIPNKDKKPLTIKTSEVESELKPVLFGEISNRSSDKKELEARVILSTAINRMKEYAKKGTPKTLAEVLSMPNQYQAYKGEQYNKYKANKLDKLGTTKKGEVDSITEKLLQEIKDGTFKDVTNGAFYYVHNKDGSIAYDDTRPLFKK
jgi:hypothetical protein